MPLGFLFLSFDQLNLDVLPVLRVDLVRNNVFKAHGRPALQIGDVIPYEIDPKHGQYVKIQLVEGKKQKTKWHDFLRVSAEAKPNT